MTNNSSIQSGQTGNTNTAASSSSSKKPIKRCNPIDLDSDTESSGFVTPCMSPRRPRRPETPVFRLPRVASDDDIIVLSDTPTASPVRASSSNGDHQPHADDGVAKVAEGKKYNSLPDSLKHYGRVVRKEHEEKSPDTRVTSMSMPMTALSTITETGMTGLARYCQHMKIVLQITGVGAADPVLVENLQAVFDSVSFKAAFVMETSAEDEKRQADAKALKDAEVSHRNASKKLLTAAVVHSAYRMKEVFNHLGLSPHKRSWDGYQVILLFKKDKDSVTMWVKHTSFSEHHTYAFAETTGLQIPRLALEIDVADFVRAVWKITGSAESDPEKSTATFSIPKDVSKLTLKTSCHNGTTMVNRKSDICATVIEIPDESILAPDNGEAGAELPRTKKGEKTKKRDAPSGDATNRAATEQPSEAQPRPQPEEAPQKKKPKKTITPVVVATESASSDDAKSPMEDAGEPEPVNRGVAQTSTYSDIANGAKLDPSANRTQRLERESACLRYFISKNVAEPIDPRVDFDVLAVEYLRLYRRFFGNHPYWEASSHPRYGEFIDQLKIEAGVLALDHDQHPVLMVSRITLPMFAILRYMAEAKLRRFTIKAKIFDFHVMYASTDDAHRDWFWKGFEVIRKHATIDVVQCRLPEIALVRTMVYDKLALTVEVNQEQWVPYVDLTPLERDTPLDVAIRFIQSTSVFTRDFVSQSNNPDKSATIDFPECIRAVAAWNQLVTFGANKEYIEGLNYISPVDPYHPTDRQPIILDGFTNLRVAALYVNTVRRFELTNCPSIVATYSFPTMETTRRLVSIAEMPEEYNDGVYRVRTHPTVGGEVHEDDAIMAELAILIDDKYLEEALVDGEEPMLDDPGEGEDDDEDEIHSDEE